MEIQGPDRGPPVVDASVDRNVDVDGSLPPEDAGDATAADTSASADGDTTPPPDSAVAVDASVPAKLCDPAPSLLACFPFEGFVYDEAPNGQQATTATNVAFVPGHDGQALKVSEHTVVALPASSTWNVTTVTVEMWFKLTSLPDGDKRMGLFDSDGRYGVFVYSDGVHCVMPDVVSIGLVAVNEWTHIACVHDGSAVIAYRNGKLFSSIPATTPPAQSQLGTAIGSNSPSGDALDGAIDSLRVWSRARSADEIAQAAQ